MNYDLLASQFERLANNPGDKRLLKQLSVEFGSMAVRQPPELIREFRIMAAAALRKLEEAAETNESIYAQGVLSALLDAGACAEGTAAQKREEAELAAIIAQPAHKAILNELDGYALSKSLLLDKVDLLPKELDDILNELEILGMVRTEGHLYRLTLKGASYGKK